MITPDQQHLMRWIREFDYNREFFAPTARTVDLLEKLSNSAFVDGRQPLYGLSELLLGYREHAQELLAAIRELEKIVG